ncbi:MAG TPA: hypothetical protein VI864_04110 [Candidatus Bathyarchaeia archaeon]|nr:hypothetical protein [Candidatus Bathyarchaeia archaeon]
MKKTYSIALLLIIAIAIGAITALQINLASQVVTEDFEQNLGEENFGEWSANKQVPQDPNNPGHLVQWHIRRASNISRSGAYSAELFIDGKQDDGTIWLERKISVKQNAQVRVSVSFWLYSEQESFNTIADVVAYAGIAKPEVEEDFVAVGSANEVAGWKNYVYEANVNTDSTSEAWVAVGISVRWETTMTYYIDDVRIETA